jgi:hypothetical protein
MRLAALFVVPCLIVGCGIPAAIICDDDTKAVVESPDRKYVAILYERNCGATTDYATTVDLRSRLWRFNSEPIFVAKSRHTVTVQWTKGRELQIRCSDCKPDQIFKAAEGWKDVEIDYIYVASQSPSK